jgi:bifunctional N-acetylglucosamine-1-phosphate-uridyltransferase/glucosamine-1-phosphate-acetyltransferase GlmU-like protein
MSQNLMTIPPFDGTNYGKIHPNATQSLENILEAPKHKNTKEYQRLNSNITRFSPKSQKIRVYEITSNQSVET